MIVLLPPVSTLLIVRGDLKGTVSKCCLGSADDFRERTPVASRAVRPSVLLAAFGLESPGLRGDDEALTLYGPDARVYAVVNKGD